MIQQLKEKVWETSSSANGFTKELVSEESTAGVWCFRVFGTTVKEACRGRLS